MLDCSNIVVARRASSNVASSGVLTGRRGLARLGLIALLLVAPSAFANPTQYILCKAVASNGDALLDGGAFQLSANASGVGNLGSYTPTVSEGGALCDAPQPFPPAGTDLVVNEVDQPVGWINAPLYPRWTITGTGLPPAGISGNGATATLSGANFAAATGTVTVRVTNAKARRVTVCKQVIDNLTLPANQGGNFTFSYASSSIATTSIPGMTATEGQTVCTDGLAGRPQPAALNIGDTTFTVNESSNPNPFNGTMAPGYPRFVIADNNGSQPLGVNGIYAATLNAALLANTAGDLTVTVQNRPDAPSQVMVCQRWEDDGVAPLQPASSFNAALGGNANSGFTNAQFTSASPIVGNGGQVSEGGVERCVIVTRPSNEAYSTASNTLMPLNFGAFAAGYPKWELYSATACPSTVANSAVDPACLAATVAAGRNNGIVAGALVASATGESVEIDWSAVPAGVLPKIVIVNRSGVTGNGALANTGNVARICKQVLDDGVAPVVSGTFALGARPVGSTPRGYSMANSTVLMGLTTGLVAEGSGVVCGGNRMALPNWVTAVPLFENVWGGATWPGNNGPVGLIVRPAAGGNTTTPASPTNMLHGTSGFYDQWASPTLNLGAGLDTGAAALVDDLDLIVNNRPSSPRRVQLCMKLVDNGLNGNESGSWSFLTDGAQSTLALTEGGPEVCQTNFVYPIDDGVNPQNVLFTTTPTTAHAGYARGYPRAEYSWNGGPVTAAPAGSIGTLFAGVGRFLIAIPDSVVTAQATGTLKFTVVMQISQQLRVCKQVLNNGNAVDDGGTFTLVASSNGNGFDTFNVSRNLAVTETTASPDGTGVVCSVANPGAGQPGIPSVATYLTVAETQPVGWNNSPGFPQWRATDGAGTLIASGAGATVPANAVPRLAGQTLDGPIEQGNITITFINRTGGSRFMQVCKELNANANPAVITAPFGLNVATNDPATPTLINSTQTVNEGQPYTTIGNCSSQAEVPVLATTVTGSETLPANWAALGGSAPGYPQWSVVDANNAPIAGLSGTGAVTSAISLAAIATPDFRIVFRNQADVSPPTIAKSFAPASIVVNGTSTATLTLTNTSATNPAVLTAPFTDTLPAGVSYVAGTAATTCTGGSVSGTSGSVTLASGAGIPAGGSCTVTFNVTSAVANNVAPCHQNVLPIGALQTGLGSNAAAASASLCVSTPANITLTKTGPATLKAGGTLVYTIALGNSGQTASGTTVTVSDVLPAGVTYVSALPAGGASAVACTGAPSLVCTVTLAAALPAGAANGTANVQIFATAPATAGTITNHASVDPTGGTAPPAAGPGCTPATSCGSASTLITTPPIVSLTKTGTASSLVNGAISYTLSVTNSGGSPTAANLLVQDLVPAGETVTAASGATCAGLPFAGDGVAVMSCTIAAPIAVGGNAVFTLTATAPASPGLITNYASTNVDGNGTPPPSPPGASCSATTPAGTVEQVMDWDVQPGAATSTNFPQIFTFGSRTLDYGYVGSTSPGLLNAVAFLAAIYPPNALGNGKVLRADNLGLVSGGSTPYEVTLTFSTPVQNLRLALFDLDGSLRGSITAADGNGVGQAVTLDPLLTGPTFLRLDAGTNGTLTPIFTGASGGRGITTTLELQRAGMNVAVPGTVKTLVLRVWSANGGDSSVYFSDLTFNEPAGNTSCASATTLVQAPPVLTLVKQVVNDNGGVATTADFVLSATGPTPISGVSGSAAVTNATVSAGSYTLGETNVAGYTAGAWSCSAGTLTGNTLVLANDQNATCTIVNNDQPASLTLVKTVTNDNGGVATISSFPLTATGPTTITGVSGTPAVTAAVVSAGTYALSEVNVAGYVAGAWSCVGGTLTGSSLALTSGQSATCTINNNDIAPNVRLVKALTAESGSQTGIAESGETLTYTITLGNSTATAFAGYDFIENVPLGATLTSVSGAGVTACATPVVGAGTCAISVASVPASGSTTVTVVFTVANPIPAGVTQIANTVSGGDTTCGVAGNTCTVTTPAAATGSLTVTKQVTGAAAGVSQINGSFSFSVNCGAGGTFTTSVAVTAGASASSTIANIPAGSSCLVNETGTVPPPLGYVWNAPTYAPAGAVTIASGSTVTVTVTNPLQGVDDVTPFAACPAGGFLLENSPTNVRAVDGYTGASSLLGTVPGSLNAAGFNPLDGRIYARSTNPPAGGNSNLSIYAIGAGGTYAVFGPTIPGMPDPQSGNVGDVDGSGYLHITGAGTGAAAVTVAVVDVTPTRPTYMTVVRTYAKSAAIGIDMAWSPSDGVFYSLRSGTNPELVTLNPTTGTVTVVGVVNGLTGSFGAQYMTLDRQLIVLDNGSGNQYRIDLTATVLSAVAAGNVGITNQTNNDGASCPNRPYFVPPTITKTVADASGDGIAQPGETLTFTITISNPNPAAYTGYNVTDPLDANTTFVSADNGGVHNGVTPGGVVNWTALTVPAQVGATPGSLVLTVVTTVNSPIAAGVATIANLAYETGTTPPDCTLTPRPANCTSLPTSATLTLVKTVTNDNGGVATVASFPLTATGPTTITGVSGTPSVTAAAVSAGTYALSEGNVAGYVAGAWSCVGGTLTGSSLALTSGQSATCTINNNDQAATLTLVKTVTNDNGGVATISSFPLTATGPTTITGVSGTPAVTAAAVSAGTYALSEVNVAGYVAGAWSCVGGTLTGSSLALTSGQSATCTINNNDIAPNVSLVKALTAESGSQPGIAEPGETLTYTITVANSTATAFAGYDLVENVPVGATLTSVTGAGVTACATPVVGAGTCAITIASVPASGSTTVTVVFTVANPIPTGITQIANTVSGGDTTCGAAGNTCTVTTPVAAILSVSKAVSAESVTSDGVAQPGEAITYTITVRNQGGTAASNVLVNERVPANTTFVSGTPSWTCAAGAVAGTACNALVNVPAASGATPGVTTLTFVVRVDDPIPVGVTRIANVVALNDQTPIDCTANPTAPACVVLPTINVGLTKTVVSVTPTGPNTYVAIYQIDVVNTGGSLASYTLTDTLGFASGVSFIGPATVTTTGGTLNPALAGGTYTPVNGTIQQLSAGPTFLAIGASHRYTVSVPIAVNAASVSAGACTGSAGNGLFNQANLTGSFALGSNACAPVSGDVVRIALAKTVRLQTDANSNGYGDAGDVLGYTFVISNPGSVTLGAIQLIDPRVSTLSCSPVTADGRALTVLRSDTIASLPFEELGSLAAGDSLTCTASYTVTAEDVANRRVVNTATTFGSAPSGQVASATSTAIFAQFR